MFLWDLLGLISLILFSCLFHFASKEMLQVVGTLLESAHHLIKAITFDAHHSHGFFRDCMLGEFGKITPKQILEAKVPFFSKVVYESLPPHALPRLPLRIMKYQGEAIWALPGVCLLLQHFVIFAFIAETIWVLLNFFEIFEHIWTILNHFEPIWSFFMVFECFWWFLMVFECFCMFLIVFVIFCIFLFYFDPRPCFKERIRAAHKPASDALFWWVLHWLHGRAAVWNATHRVQASWANEWCFECCVV